MSASTLVAPVPVSPRSLVPNALLERTRISAAAGFILGVFLAFLGFSWDIQWHIDVGPDTFFTAPHLVLYSGVAIAGLISLAMVLLTTWHTRRGDAAEVELEGVTQILGGRLRGPLGYIIGGFGALFFLLFGLMDQWWHTVYGFDVTLVSPPHVGLILSIMVTMAGCLTALAWHIRQTPPDRVQHFLACTGAVFAAAVLVAFITPTLTDLLPWALFGVISWPNVVVSSLYPAAILMTVSIIRRPWAGTLFGLLFTALDLLITAVVPEITYEYARSIGLFMRDTATGEVVVPGLLPTYVLVAGVAVDLVLAMGRRVGWRVALVVPIAGAVAALTLRVLEPSLPLYQPSPLDPAEIAALRMEISSAVATSSLILAPILGAGAGWFGWLLGIVLKWNRAKLPASKTLQAMLPIIVVATLMFTPLSVQAHAPDTHHEIIQVGPYGVQIGFSEWPIRADRSLDITFEPEGGIAGKSATIRVTDPQGDWYEVGPLGRHPSQRDLWGLDLIALPSSGNWTIALTINGPEGSGTGTLTSIPVGERPGPPLAPMWLVAALPLVFLVWLGIRGWHEIRPGRSPEARAWSA